MRAYVIYFLTGGLFTVLIVALEESNQRLLSGLATLVPVFTLVSYLFIGQTAGGTAVSEHAKLVLLGTLVSWVPYMLTVAVLSPRLGTNRAILAGLGVFFVLAVSYLLLVQRFNLFQAS